MEALLSGKRQGRIRCRELVFLKNVYSIADLARVVHCKNHWVSPISETLCWERVKIFTLTSLASHRGEFFINRWNCIYVLSENIHWWNISLVSRKISFKNLRRAFVDTIREVAPRMNISIKPEMHPSYRPNLVLSDDGTKIMVELKSSTHPQNVIQTLY